LKTTFSKILESDLGDQTMAIFLSEEWLEELVATNSNLPKQKEVDGGVKFVITSTPLGKIQFCLKIVSGKVQELLSGATEESDVTITFRYPDAVAWFKGELDTDLAYMNGQCKFEGDYTRFMYDLRSVFSGEAWTTNLENLASNTQFE